jgi:hypothetical protein
MPEKASPCNSGHPDTRPAHRRCALDGAEQTGRGSPGPKSGLVRAYGFSGFDPSARFDVDFRHLHQRVQIAFPAHLAPRLGIRLFSLKQVRRPVVLTARAFGYADHIGLGGSVFAFKRQHLLPGARPAVNCRFGPSYRPIATQKISIFRKLFSATSLQTRPLVPGATSQQC